MSSKELKPTLGGARIRTRKRNIAVPLDKGSFADTVVSLYLESKEEEGDEVLTQQQHLDVFVKTLETSDLDFTRYGDTLFEVLFTGGASGGSGQKEGELTLEYTVLATENSIEGITPFLNAFQIILRRRPFLIKNLENIIKRLLQQLEHYTPEQQDKMAISLALIFTMKLGIPPENLMSVLLNDQLVAKGTMLRFITSFFKAYLSSNALDELMTLLKKSRTEDLMLFFPMQKRTATAFKAHFTEFDIPSLVQYQEHKLAEEGLRYLELTLIEHIEETPNGVTEAIELVNASKKENSLPDSLLIPVIWRSLMSVCQLGGKNQQQASNTVLRQAKMFSKFLSAFVTTPRLEIELINCIQLYCYEQTTLMKVFQDIIHCLYDCDVCSEEAVVYWARKGTVQKGRQVFLEAMQPFLKWLDEAESDDDEEDAA